MAPLDAKSLLYRWEQASRRMRETGTAAAQGRGEVRGNETRIITTAIVSNLSWRVRLISRILMRTVHRPRGTRNRIYMVSRFDDLKRGEQLLGQEA
jgi:hypothetical protein